MGKSASDNAAVIWNVPSNITFLSISSSLVQIFPMVTSGTILVVPQSTTSLFKDEYGRLVSSNYSRMGE